jgi:radical SAM protein with 4Fe4S-binding SPASM domain
VEKSNNLKKNSFLKRTRCPGGFYLHELTLQLTDKCNLGCSYCFQKRRTHDLPFSSIRLSLDLFRDAFHKHSFLVFYGGEPLLSFDTIRQTIAHIQNHPILRKTRFRYSLSTNGTLLNEEIIRFLDTHQFRVNMSHDGTAQEATRPGRMNSLVLENLERLVRSTGIELTTNSVFVPGTVGEIFRSARFLIERGVKDCSLAYSINTAWDAAALDQMREQIRELGRYLLGHYRRHSSIPIGNFRGRQIRTVFWCSAGQDRLAVAADGRLWGCRFFADFFAGEPEHPEIPRYCYGDVKKFEDGARDGSSAIHGNYALLRQEVFSSERKACRKCRRLLSCSACPAAAAFYTGAIGRIPAWLCDMKKIWQEETGRFWRAARQDLGQ